MSENLSTCRCRGEIKNCLYCQGSGQIDAARRAQADDIVAGSFVLHCPDCNRQNRVLKDRLDAGEMPHCLDCQAELLRPASSPFNRPPFNRKK